MNHEIKRIGNYDLLRELARGSFGRVYLARHAVLTNRLVAMKLMLSAPLTSLEKQENFLQEARFLEMLKHPHILPLIDVGFHEDIPYLVIEYAASGSLRDRLTKRLPNLLPLEESLRVLFQIGQALQYAHQQHIIHRDLKPENIVFNEQGNALLTDFGISTTLSSASVKDVDNEGTPAYMAPEQFRGTISKESDQYALGCIAYELFTGHPPFSAPDFIALGFKHILEQPLSPTISRPQLPEYISQAVLKALAKDRSQRFPNVWAFVTALQTLPYTQEATEASSETNLPTLPSNRHRVAAADLNPSLVSSASTPLLPSDSPYSTLLAQPDSGFSDSIDDIERQQVTDPGKKEAFSVIGPYQQSQIPLSQYPMTPFPPTPQDFTPYSGREEKSRKNRRKQIVLILLAASLALLVILGSVLFFVLPSAFSSNSVPNGTSTQRSSQTSQIPNQTQSSTSTALGTPTRQSAVPGSQDAKATATSQTTATSIAAPSPTATRVLSSTPTQQPTPTPTFTPTPTPPPLSESVTVPFTAGTPGVSTQNSYSGTVQITVSGTGNAASTKWSDAFYIYTDSSGNPLNPPNHASCWVMYINSQPTDSFVSTPSYQASHTYTFTMIAPGGTLSFGICDSVTSDNSGSFSVTVTQE